MYRDGAFPELKERNFHGSWLDWFLKEIETFHGASPWAAYLPCAPSASQPLSGG
jgi:hypothetical protein